MDVNRDSRRADPVAAFERWSADCPLRRWREDPRYLVSQSKLAAMLGVPQPYVHYWESGTRQPNAEQLIDLGRLMGVNPRTLGSRWQAWLRKRPKP